VNRGAGERIGDATAKGTGWERRKFMVGPRAANKSRPAFEHVRGDQASSLLREGGRPRPRCADRQTKRPRTFSAFRRSSLSSNEFERAPAVATRGLGAMTSPSAGLVASPWIAEGKGADSILAKPTRNLRSMRIAAPSLHVHHAFSYKHFRPHAA